MEQHCLFAVWRTSSPIPCRACLHSATVCPKGLNPGKAIAKIKQAVATGVPV